MTKEEFLEIQLGDKIYDKDLDMIGRVIVYSRGDILVEYIGISSLICYDISEDKHCFENIEKIY